MNTEECSNSFDKYVMNCVMIDYYWRHLMSTSRISNGENLILSHHYGDQCLI